ncbi:MAG: type II toxin-antitoxin system PemK/MazF family toxin, partial [Clostridiales bacterium]|nr:type II toxin-antitoxin system PemK/MazF family toxin [Clostridiales bacterium]NLF27494.1 type II toxin-antitoxin system PemK/MazF family toxin [Clostridiales bacterium]
VNKARLPTHVPVPAGANGLQKDSVILAEQIRTLDKRRLRERIGTLPPEIMEKVAEAVRISLGFTE